MAECFPTIGIIGAGTMGAGIAQVAATAGWTVQLIDVDEATVRIAIDGVRRRLDRLVEKDHLTAEQRDDIANRLRAATGPDSFTSSRLVIEAVVEDLDAKVNALRSVIHAVSNDTIIATNTSSLSISRLGQAIGQGRRTVGMHFFNPAPLMKLVEIVRGDETDQAVIDDAARIASDWGKTAVRAKDTPGFIVNRVARPFYLEAWRIVQDGYAPVDEIDCIMRDFGGFRMGPFELTDLIGQDVNAATSHSLWERLDRPSRLKPSRLQIDLVERGDLGRKTNRGAYSYEGEELIPAVAFDRRPLVASKKLQDAIRRFIDGATRQSGSELEQYVFARILAAIINEAGWAHRDGVASEADIDIAMKLGTNYLKGPFEWAEQISGARVTALLAALNETVDDDRFSPAESSWSAVRRI
ncbi:MAG: 3-hydroxyacyl-CoA dehydrogenase NAD-binding domain-containing protein [Planctomycetota bacterium]|nr:3-hydroxyacyl-CoA dehydrogenase NAD-binding domain-containing protein [Planctomycetota bacterium]